MTTDAKRRHVGRGSLRRRSCAIDAQYCQMRQTCTLFPLSLASADGVSTGVNRGDPSHHDKDKGRWPVQLPGGGKARIKGGNLQVVDGLKVS